MARVNSGKPGEVDVGRVWGLRLPPFLFLPLLGVLCLSVLCAGEGGPGDSHGEGGGALCDGPLWGTEVPDRCGGK